MGPLSYPYPYHPALLNMTKTPPAAPEPGGLEEAYPTNDASMVFSSKQGSGPTTETKKGAIKAARDKLKMRRSTPAPSFKRNGRKQLVNSPLPEDKQICKRIIFGDDTNEFPDAPKCKAEIFPAVLRRENEEPPYSQCKEVSLEDGHHNLAIVCYDAASIQDVPCVAGSGAEEVAMVIYQGESEAPLHSRSMVVEESKSKCTLNGERVFISEMEGETTHLLESILEHCQIERSHVSQPKEDNLLLLASLNSADSLDMAAAQPFLAGGLPEKAGNAPVHGVERLAAKDVSALPLGAPHGGLSGPMGETEAQPTKGLVGPGGVLGWGGPTPAPSDQASTFVAPLDEFPPLEKGILLKIRNRFEAGSKTRFDGSRGSGSGAWGSDSGSGQLAPSGRCAGAADNSAGTSARYRGLPSYRGGRTGRGSSALGRVTYQDTG